MKFPAVLVLNASYEALDLVAWENAVVLVVRDKARIHQAHESGAVVHSAHLAVQRRIWRELSSAG